MDWKAWIPIGAAAVVVVAVVAIAGEAPKREPAALPSLLVPKEKADVDATRLRLEAQEPGAPVPCDRRPQGANCAAQALPSARISPRVPISEAPRSGLPSAVRPPLNNPGLPLGRSQPR